MTDEQVNKIVKAISFLQFQILMSSAAISIMLFVIALRTK